MARETNKTSQIGVRFDKFLLEDVIHADLARSPQTALNLYEKSYLELVELKVKINNQPENKERILKEREAVIELPTTENPELERKKGESSIEYRLRMIELKEIESKLK